MDLQEEASFRSCVRAMEAAQREELNPEKQKPPARTLTPDLFMALVEKPKK